MAFVDAIRAPLAWPGSARIRGRHNIQRLRQRRPAGRQKRADDRATDERAAARAALRLDPELARKLLEPMEEPPPFPGVAGVKTTVFERQCCPFCRGLHSRKCPAVKEIEYHLDGRVQRVTYWREWDDSAVLWREDIEEAAAWQDEPQALT
jgi:hypothetical protein